MTNSVNTPAVGDNDELDIHALLLLFWSGKWIIVGFTVILAAIGLFVALSLPNIYKSEALLAPVEDTQGGGLSAIAGQLGGLASIAGVDLGGGSANKTVVALEVLKSRDFLIPFLDENDLKLSIMAADGWDTSTQEFTYDEDIYDVASKTWVRDVRPPRVSEPSLLETHKVFVDEFLSVKQDKDTGLVTISVKHYSPHLAQAIVNKLVEALNKRVKTDDITEAQKSIAFLQKALEQTNNSDMKRTFYELIQSQQQTRMLASVRDDYVLRMIDPPIIAEEKVEPNRALILVVFAFLGGVFGIIAVLLINAFRSNSQSENSKA